MLGHSSDAWVFDRCGGHPALDFANTVSRRHEAAPVERLPDYGALVAFARQLALVPDAEADRLLRWAARHRQDAAAIVETVIPLREALYWTFVHVARRQAPRDEDLAILNAWIGRLELGPDLAWRWADGPRSPDALMLPIVAPATDLLRSPTRERVRVCAADTCRWIYLDMSKNRSRRWCDMKQCGNREKARRFAERRAQDDVG